MQKLELALERVRLVTSNIRIRKAGSVMDVTAPRKFLISAFLLLLLTRLQSPANDFELPAEHYVDRLRIRNMLLLQDAGSERVLVVGFEHGHGLLHDDRSVIQFLVDEVHGAAGNFHPISESLLLRFESWERGQQRWMDVENPARELLHEPRREQAHISRQADEVDVVLL